MSYDNIDNIDVECPVCGSTTRHQIHTVEDFDTGLVPYRIMSCEGCELGRTDPAPDAKTLDSLYNPEYYGGPQQKFSGVIEWLTVYGNHLRVKRLQSLLQQRAPVDRPYRVLDIGCGRASLLKSFFQCGFECHGSERENFRQDHSYIEHDITFHYGDIQDLQLPEDYFDLIVVWHVLEHLERPVKVIETCRKLLCNSGMLVVSVPNYTSLQSIIFRRHWFHLDIPRHLFHFGRETLHKLLLSCDFKPVSTSTCSAEQSIFGFIQSSLNMLKVHNQPNSFYQALKKSTSARRPYILLSGMALTAFILPVALLEYVYSCITGRGAVITIISKKSDLSRESSC